MICKIRSGTLGRLDHKEINLPPLRERGHDDLDRLIDHLLFEACRRHCRTLRLAAAARARLHGWRWPGNVRELENRVEAAVVLAMGPEIQADEIELPVATEEGFTPMGTLEEVELAYIRHVLGRCNGNRSQAARILGIARNTLARRLGEAEDT